MAGSLADVTGFEVEAMDGKAGKVQGTEVTEDGRPRCLVVKPGLMRRRHVISVEVVSAVDRGHHRLRVRMTKHEIAKAPGPMPERWSVPEPADRWSTDSQRYRAF